MAGAPRNRGGSGQGCPCAVPADYGFQRLMVSVSVSAGAMAFASGPLPTLATKNLRVGAEWDMSLFDFATMGPTRARARVSGRQRIPWAGSLRNCYRIVVTDTLGREMLTGWSDGEGRLLEMEFAGVKFVRRSDEG